MYVFIFGMLFPASISSVSSIESLGSFLLVEPVLKYLTLRSKYLVGKICRFKFVALFSSIGNKVQKYFKK